MSVQFLIQKNIEFYNEPFQIFLNKNPSIPYCQREYTEERVMEFYNKILRDNNENDSVPYLGIIHCAICDNDLYILDGQHRYFAYLKYNDVFHKDFNITYILKHCVSKDELKQYFKDLNNNFHMNEIILKDDNIDKCYEIKKHIANKYPKHISKTQSPKYPNIQLDQLCQYLLLSFNGLDIQKMIEKIEQMNQKIKKELQEDCKFDLLDSANKKNGFYMAYLFMKTENESKRKKISQSVRNRLWEDNYPDSNRGKCFCCGMEVMTSNFHAGHILSVRNGGSNHIENLKIICSCCNLSMGTQNLLEFKTMYF